MKPKYIAMLLGGGAGLYFLSSKLLMVISLFVVGTIIASGIEKGKALKASYAFHKCCSAVEWALMSFYLFAFETLASRKAEGRLYYLAGALLLTTLAIYVFATANIEAVLTGTDVKLHETHAEKLNVFCAAFSIMLLVAFVAYLRFGWGMAI